MDKPRSFADRLEAARAADEELGVKGDGCYRNGQIVAGEDDSSQWDNFDRYFKFYNITSD